MRRLLIVSRGKNNQSKIVLQGIEREWIFAEAEKGTAVKQKRPAPLGTGH